MKINNITVSGCLSIFKINLSKIELPNSKYNPKRFNALIIKLPKPTFLLFNTGKFVIIGCKSKEEILVVSKIFEKMISNCLNSKIFVNNLKICSIATSGDFGHKIDLHKYYSENKEFTQVLNASAITPFTNDMDIRYELLSK